MSKIPKKNGISDEQEKARPFELSSWDISTNSQFTSPGIHNIYENLQEEIIALQEEVSQSIGKFYRGGG